MNNQEKLSASNCSIKVAHIVGARPNFMKIAPLMKEMLRHSERFSQILIHTGQHYDEEMSKSFFNDLRLPKPDIYLGVGSGTHAEQTGKIMIEFERICIQQRPDLVIVVGDVNSTIACALVAAKLCIPLAHIEAGLRSFDRTMPEEINRIITDQLSDYLFTTCEDANKNLIKEGILESKIFFVGNIMIDTLISHMKIAEHSVILEKLGLRRNNSVKKYALITLHRPSNVDKKEILKGILNVLNELTSEVQVIFPAHPRTFKQIKKFGLQDKINFDENLSLIELNKMNRTIRVIQPLGYIDFLCLMSNAMVVLTDSGGIQEETTVLGIPCLTLRNNTERPITVKEGTNNLVGNDPCKIINTVISVIKSESSRKRIPKYWDGKTAGRIIETLITKL